MDKINNILFATDNSPCALEACEYALGLARVLGAKLTVLSVVQDVPDLSIFDINMGRSSSEKKWVEARREYLQSARDNYIDNIKVEYKSKYADADEIIVEIGIPDKLILLIAREKHSDLIVIGMRGRGRTLNEALMGDTARHVLHNAKVPVLVVPPCDEMKLKKEKQGDSKVVSLKD